MAIKLDNLLQRLGTHLTGETLPDQDEGVQTVRSFIVHGHDHQSLYELVYYLQITLELDKPTILQ